MKAVVRGLRKWHEGILAHTDNHSRAPTSQPATATVVVSTRKISANGIRNPTVGHSLACQKLPQRKVLYSFAQCCCAIQRAHTQRTDTRTRTNRQLFCSVRTAVCLDTRTWTYIQTCACTHAVWWESDRTTHVHKHADTYMNTQTHTRTRTQTSAARTNTHNRSILLCSASLNAHTHTHTHYHSLHDLAAPKISATKIHAAKTATRLKYKNALIGAKVGLFLVWTSRNKNG